MNILNFQKPEKINLKKADNFHGFFEFKPLEPGFGQTIGNSLRRILLSSLEGYAISSIRIAGVDHEFSTIKGVYEDVVDIILNIKQIRLKKVLEEDEYQYLLGERDIVDDQYELCEKVGYDGPITHFVGEERYYHQEINKDRIEP